MKCKAATARGAFDAELVAVEVSGPRGTRRGSERDEHPRPDTHARDARALSRRHSRPRGTVTAGNSSGSTTAPPQCCSPRRRPRGGWDCEPLARFVACASAGVAPDVMGLGPIPATRKVLARAGVTVEQLDLVEINEAFAAQAIACARELKLDPTGPTLTAARSRSVIRSARSGARIVTTLLARTAPP